MVSKMNDPDLQTFDRRIELYLLIVFIPPNGADPPAFPPSANDVVRGLPLMAGRKLGGGESAHEVWFLSSFTSSMAAKN
jgi:hypothetical protein